VDLKALTGDGQRQHPASRCPRPPSPLNAAPQPRWHLPALDLHKGPSKTKLETDRWKNAYRYSACCGILIDIPLAGRTAADARRQPWMGSPCLRLEELELFSLARQVRLLKAFLRRSPS